MYELTYILTPILNDDQNAEVLDRVTRIIERRAGGTIIEIDNWGLRRMAYPVAKKRNGYYVNMYFKGPSQVVDMVEQELRINDNVLRYLTLAMDKGMIEHYHRRTRQKQAAMEAAAKPAKKD
ncbi:MAG: 30S ribosomal protein S6 [Bacteroidota bacterium]|nr:30S ribosomal protein S6 [Bacteroidota bacterium]